MTFLWSTFWQFSNDPEKHALHGFESLGTVSQRDSKLLEFCASYVSGFLVHNCLKLLCKQCLQQMCIVAVGSFWYYPKQALFKPKKNRSFLLPHAIVYAELIPPKKIRSGIMLFTKDWFRVFRQCLEYFKKKEIVVMKVASHVDGVVYVIVKAISSIQLYRVLYAMI